jgi:hypothetical protein
MVSVRQCLVHYNDHPLYAAVSVKPYAAIRICRRARTVVPN